jgi:hypothetical protein
VVKREEEDEVVLVEADEELMLDDTLDVEETGVDEVLCELVVLEEVEDVMVELLLLVAA